MRSRPLLGASVLVVLGLADVVAIDVLLAPRVLAGTHASDVAPREVAAASAGSPPARESSVAASASIVHETSASAVASIAPSAPEPAAIEADAAPAREGAQLVIIPFALDSASVPSSSDGALDALAARVLADPRLTLTIEGHADRSGTTGYNAYLSGERALAVADALVRRGVPRKRLSARGLGDAAPVDTGASIESFAKNRRVEVRIARAE